ncbi:adenylate/guanylate cyclase domain-containing protein [Rhizobium sp. P32RR-XVIII]|uniref:adenylate/guanylate cyclase domain-containing protein n=1 Tax=Rhizobium sp. P32RR-XVIII TaxID=2726738 RepID=UPI001456B764|nr:adenylate/guanylate cyclase domain-containing protein [Rhizobium sp. P32RR-XVIII]NLS06891.1 adenylate/guanylate cyclase domain-containing protein [Rhizobium sp. P32RR-XVIII]
MDDSHVKEITTWLMQAGLMGLPEADLLAGFCERCNAGGLQVERASAVMDTLHPVYERRAFRWDRSRWVQPVFEFGFATPGGVPSDWHRSAFHYLKTTGGNEVRRRLLNGDPADFYLLDAMKADGFTDFIAMAHRFGAQGAIGEIDCFFSHFGTRATGGFSQTDEEALRNFLPYLALAVKCVVVSGVASTIAKVYLGEDAASQVLHGRITRGRSERISAALWFSDLANFTRISDTVDPDEIIPMLNDYADAVISSIKEAGGEVLKLMGDGTLAIFRGEVSSESCAAALKARTLLDKRLVDLNAQRRIEGRPVTDIYLGLHFGDVFYGNIGSQDRLDFTVIGPAVNEVSRIVSLCRSLQRKLLMSAPFAAIVPPSQTESLLPIGSHVLRGVSRAQELFTMTSESATPATRTTALETGVIRGSGVRAEAC